MPLTLRTKDEAGSIKSSLLCTGLIILVGVVLAFVLNQRDDELRAAASALHNSRKVMII